MSIVPPWTTGNSFSTSPKASLTKHIGGGGKRRYVPIKVKPAQCPCGEENCKPKPYKKEGK